MQAGEQLPKLAVVEDRLMLPAQGGDIPLERDIEAIARLNHAGIVVVLLINDLADRFDGDLSLINRACGVLHRALLDASGHIDGICYCSASAQRDGETKPITRPLRATLNRFSVPPTRSMAFVGSEKAANLTDQERMRYVHFEHSVSADDCQFAHAIDVLLASD